MKVTINLDSQIVCLPGGIVEVSMAAPSFVDVDFGRVYLRGEPRLIEVGVHPGWWCVRVNHSGYLGFAWFNGKEFSIPVALNLAAGTDGASAGAVVKSRLMTYLPADVRVFGLWPAGARVARVNPATGQVTGAGPVNGRWHQVGEIVQ